MSKLDAKSPMSLSKYKRGAPKILAASMMLSCLSWAANTRADTPTTPTMQPFPTTAESARAQSQKETHNKAVAMAFFHTMNTKDWEAAKQYIGDHWIEHNEASHDGIEGLKEFFDFLKERAPDHLTIVRRVFAQGDLVVVHAQDLLGPGDRGTAVINILRFEHGKIVEHWDVHQDVPGFNNYNGMF